MLASPRERLGALAVLALVLVGLLVWYGSLGPGGYPSQQYHGPEPGEYVGQQVTVAGTVLETDPVRIEVEYDADGRAEYVVTGLGFPVEPGDRLRASGRLTDPRTVDAERGYTVRDAGLWYAWVISFLAGLWVLARIARHWRFDADVVALVPRLRRTDPDGAGSPDDVGRTDGPGRTDDPTTGGGDGDA